MMQALDAGADIRNLLALPKLGEVRTGAGQLVNQRNHLCRCARGLRTRCNDAEGAYDEVSQFLPVPIDLPGLRIQKSIRSTLR